MLTTDSDAFKYLFAFSEIFKVFSQIDLRASDTRGLTVRGAAVDRLGIFLEREYSGRVGLQNNWSLTAFPSKKSSTSIRTAIA